MITADIEGEEILDFRAESSRIWNNGIRIRSGFEDGRHSSYELIS